VFAESVVTRVTAEGDKVGHGEDAEEGRAVMVVVVLKKVQGFVFLPKPEGDFGDGFAGNFSFGEKLFAGGVERVQEPLFAAFFKSSGGGCGGQREDVVLLEASGNAIFFEEPGIVALIPEHVGKVAVRRDEAGLSLGDAMGHFEAFFVVAGFVQPDASAGRRRGFLRWRMGVSTQRPMWVLRLYLHRRRRGVCRGVRVIRQPRVPLVRQRPPRSWVSRRRLRERRLCGA
jgi:hypothetical protein